MNNLDRGNGILSLFPCFCRTEPPGTHGARSAVSAPTIQMNVSAIRIHRNILIVFATDRFSISLKKYLLLFLMIRTIRDD